MLPKVHPQLEGCRVNVGKRPNLVSYQVHSVGRGVLQSHDKRVTVILDDSDPLPCRVILVVASGAPTQDYSLVLAKKEKKRARFSTL